MGYFHLHGACSHIGMVNEIAMCRQQQRLAGVGSDFKQQVGCRGIDMFKDSER